MNNATFLALFLRLLRRDWHAGKLRLLALSCAVAVFAMSIVLTMTDQFRRSLQLQSATLLGADALLVSDQPIAEAQRERARKQGLGAMRTAVFPGMVASAQQTLLASIKVVDDAYPLRGRLRLAASADPDQHSRGDREETAAQAVSGDRAQSSPRQEAGEQAGATHRVRPGEVWLEIALMRRLEVAVGDSIRIGEREFQVSGLILEEPDRAAAFVNFAPRLMLHWSDLPSTGLIQESSRITWRLGVTADAQEKVLAWEREAAQGLERGQRLEDRDNGRPEIEITMQRARLFLGLLAAVIAIVSAVAIAIAARHFAEGHRKGYALMRVMGCASGTLLLMLVLEFMAIGLLAGLLGAFLGAQAAQWFAFLVPVKLATMLPPPTWDASLQALLVGMLLLSAFSLGGWLRLVGVAPNILLRDEGSDAQGESAALRGFRGVAPWLAMLAAMLGVTVWLSASTRAALQVLGGLGLAFLATGLVLGALWWLAGKNCDRLPLSWVGTRLAWRRLGRRPLRHGMQQSAVTLGVMALLMLSVVQEDLIEAWQRSASARLPDRFLINIQQDQLQPVREKLESMLGAQAQSDPPTLYPMVRGRLIERNGNRVGPEDYDEGRAKRLLDREFNLSYGEGPIPGNRLREGQWPSRGGGDASVEEGLAATLGLEMGDEIVFEIAGEKVRARITSIRQLSWESMQVNFFVVLSPELLENEAQSWIASLRTQGIARFDQRLIQAFPNLTAVDIGAAVDQARSLVRRLAEGLQWLFVLALASGALVVVAGLQLAQAERARDAQLLRVLGASQGQLRSMVLAELLSAGLIGGVLAGSAAYLIGLSLARGLLDLPGYASWEVVAGGVLIQVAVSLVAGVFALRRLLQHSPAEGLRRSA